MFYLFLEYIKNVFNNKYIVYSVWVYLTYLRIINAAKSYINIINQC